MDITMLEGVLTELKNAGYTYGLDNNEWRATLTVYLGDGRGLASFQFNEREVRYADQTPALGNDIELVNLRSEVLSRVATVFAVAAASDRLKDAVNDQVKWIGVSDAKSRDRHHGNVVRASRALSDAATYLEKRRSENWRW